jgi:NADH:ubiquinone oxidoreductase subunit H
MIAQLTALLSHPLGQMIASLAAIMAFLGVNGLVLLYAERKVAGFIQRRRTLRSRAWAAAAVRRCGQADRQAAGRERRTG